MKKRTLRKMARALYEAMDEIEGKAQMAGQVEQNHDAYHDEWCSQVVQVMEEALRGCEMCRGDGTVMATTYYDDGEVCSQETPCPECW